MERHGQAEVAPRARDGESAESPSSSSGGCSRDLCGDKGGSKDTIRPSQPPHPLLGGVPGSP